ncbi:uncharacterized protein [Cherax quadricarinatus]|uniref:uncharacterized protein n=1 Tax=Cherax quadricarinatus TaxID=27406 RepID=UPI00387E7D91
MDDFEDNFIDTDNVCVPVRSGTCDENAGRKDDRIRVCGDEGKEVKREDKDLVCSEKLTGGIISKDMEQGKRKKDEIRRKGMEEEVRREEKNIKDEEGKGTRRKKEKKGNLIEYGLKEPVKEDDNKAEKVEHCILIGADGDGGDHILPGTNDDGKEELHDDQNGGSNYVPSQAVVINVTHRGAGTDDSSCTTQTTDDDTDTNSDSDLSSVSTRAARMLPDSEDGFDMVRTLRHYRRRRRRSSDSSTTDSNCSCKSCVSRTNWSFFSTEEGPPGGEGTIYRRAAIWLESIKYLYVSVVSIRVYIQPLFYLYNFIHWSFSYFFLASLVSQCS